jgi:UDP-N-acetylmuramoyl-L-alanyl-D-glutamate--2,6-diaminopimelate ligase
MMVSSKTVSHDQDLVDLVKLFDASGNFDDLDNIIITDIADDSRQVLPGSLFIARVGTDVHGERFISAAIKNGAVAILRQSTEVVNTPNKISIKWITTAINKSIPEISIVFSNESLSNLGITFYKNPSRKIQITGITGTNGKTSCAYILANLINIEQKCGFIGTIGKGDIGSLVENTNTTQGVIENQKTIAEMYGNGIKQIVMEVSSHALTQHRIEGVDVNCAVFTNLTHDHLDYHQSFEKYGAAKLELFRLNTLDTAVINIDDAFSEQILKVISSSVKVLTYGIDNKNADIVAEIIEYNINSTLVNIKTKKENITVSVPLLGKFNISNLLAVCGVLLSQGQLLVEIAKIILDIQSVKGRMQCVGGNNELPLVVIDYAHTPDALESVLTTLRLHCSGMLWCVFGCGGDRDKLKRTAMGKIAFELADKIIITNDNPRTEEPTVIANEIISGIKDKKFTKIVLDRKDAIQSAIQQAGKSDVILIAGKGHEDYQIIDNIKYHFDDVKISLDSLNKMGMK